MKNIKRETEKDKSQKTTFAGESKLDRADLPEVEITLCINEAQQVFKMKPVEIVAWGPPRVQFGVQTDYIVQLVSKEAVATIFCPDIGSFNLLHLHMPKLKTFKLKVGPPLAKGIHLLVYEKPWPNQTPRVCMREYPNREDGSGSYIIQFDPALKAGSFLTLLRQDFNPFKELFYIDAAASPKAALGDCEVLISAGKDHTVLILESPDMAKKLHDDLLAGRTNTVEVSGSVKAAIWNDQMTPGSCYGHMLENLPLALNSALLKMGAHATDCELWKIERDMKRLSKELWPKIYKAIV